MKASWANILETSTVTVTSAATNYPAYRLYDRFGDLMWRAGSTATQTIHVDQGASPVAVDLLAIPAGHLLDGCTFAWERSANNTDWSTIVTGWTQSGPGIIVKQPSAPVTYRYLRLVISGASVASEAGEIWMGSLTDFDARPDFGAKTGWEYAAEREESPSRIVTYTQMGDDRIAVDYEIALIDATERALFEAWFAAWAGSQPFFFEDEDGDQYWAEFRSPPRLEDTSPGRSSTSLSVLQVLG